MVTKKIGKPDKYADYRYQIVTPEELREANWMIERGDYKDLDDYIDRFTRSEIRRMKNEDVAKKRRADARRKSQIDTNSKGQAA